MSMSEENRRELNDAPSALLEVDAEPLPILTEEDVIQVLQEGDVREEKCPMDGSTLYVIKKTLGRENGSVCLKCPMEGCVTFMTTDNAQVVLEGLAHAHPELKKEWFALTCQCERRPFLKLSRSAKNPNRLYLTCARKRDQNPCKYFQWVDSAPFCPRQEAVPLNGRDRWSTLTKDQRQWLLDQARMDTSDSDPREARYKEFRRNVAHRMIRRVRNEPYPGQPRPIHSFSRSQQLLE